MDSLMLFSRVLTATSSMPIPPSVLAIITGRPDERARASRSRMRPHTTPGAPSWPSTRLASRRCSYSQHSVGEREGGVMLRRGWITNVPWLLEAEVDADHDFRVKGDPARHPADGE